MGKIVIGSGGGSGIGSSDCTATKNQVLAGFTAITKDSDDEVITGTIPNKGAATYASKIEFIYKSLRLTFPKGAYLDLWDGYDGPVVYISEQDLRDVIGYLDAGKVLEGTTIAGREGTMPNKGAVTQALNAGGSYVIPAGYHNGAGKVTANSLAGQTSATATAGQILSGQTAWVNGNKVTGTMPNQGAVSQALAINGSYTIPAGYHSGSGKVTQSIATMGGQTVTPSSGQQTVNTSGKYMTGNVVIAGDGNLNANNIKSGVSIFGVKGAMVDYSYLAQGQVAF